MIDLFLMAGVESTTLVWRRYATPRLKRLREAQV